MSALASRQSWTRWFRFTRFDAYIVRQFLLYLVLGMFAVVILVIDAADKMNQFWDQKLTLGQIFGDYYANFLTYILNKFFPLYVFLAVVAFTARMSQSSEIIALLSSGTSFIAFYCPMWLRLFCSQAFRIS
jgi:lipopolysaccharide export system permease protein